MEKLRATAAGLAEILYMRAAPDMQTLGYAFPHLSRRSLQNLIKAFSEGLLQRAISYRRMRVLFFFWPRQMKRCAPFYSQRTSHCLEVRRAPTPIRVISV